MSSSPLAQRIPTELFPEGLARSLRTGRDLMVARKRAIEDENLPTHCEPLDRLLQGGIRRGRLTELVSWGSSGRFSMVLGALSATTRGGEAAALIDLGDALSPSSADAAGVELERLLWVRPRNIKEALLATEAIIACGMPLVVLDLGVPPIPGGRGAEAFWLRLHRSAQSRRSAVLVTSPYRVTGTAAHVVIESKNRRVAWHGSGLQPRLLAQLSNRIELAKGPGWQRMGAENLIFRPQSSVAEAAPDPGSSAGTAAPPQSPTKELSSPQRSSLKEHASSKGRPTLEEMRARLLEASKSKPARRSRKAAGSPSTEDPLMGRSRRRAIA